MLRTRFEWTDERMYRETDEHTEEGTNELTVIMPQKQMASVTRKRDLRTLQKVYTKITPHTMSKTPIRDQNGYTAKKICAVDVTSVKKCRP